MYGKSQCGKRYNDHSVGGDVAMAMGKYTLVKENLITVAILRDDGARVPTDLRNYDFGTRYANWLEGKDSNGEDMGKGPNIPDAAIQMAK